jgi:tRNA A58 N-methylase Trm61
MVELSSIKYGKTVADLGSGDGRISIAFAKRGGIVTGYELDPKLVKKSNILISQAKINQSIHILNKDFWSTNLSKFDIVTIYPMPDIMLPLEKKLLNELKPGAQVLTNYYQFPKWVSIVCKNNIYLYQS